MKGRKPRVQKADRTGPTDETKEKLQPDVVRALVDAGRLQPEHLSAASEIRDTWLAFGKGLFPAPSGDGIKIDRTTFPSPIDRLTDAELARWETKYKPWATAVGSVQTTIDVVVDNIKPANLDEVGQLRHSLHRYAVIAGWLTDRA